MYPFRMYGRTIQIHRFSVSYTEERPTVSEGGEPTTETIPITDSCHTREEAEAIAVRTNGAITALDTTAYAWLDGIIVDDVPDTYAEAIKIYDMGRTAYEELQNTPSQLEDILAMTVDQEYRLTILEVL